ncbi:MAG: phytanoyl-CoA dioxygenase family protein [Pirellulales bacterium]|nr:phytanoyl-CoA dioxygenase family protein [Pirellulales bacterium]
MYPVSALALNFDSAGRLAEAEAAAFDVAAEPAGGARDAACAATEQYRRYGFLKVRGVLSEQQAAYFRDAAVAFRERTPSYRKDAILDQHVNVWRSDDVLRRLTLNGRIAAIAQRLAGVALRLWHDQLLVKTAGDSRATEFHQDQPYWPHAGASQPITAWIALVDVPVERGCMSFLPGSHRQRDVPRHELDQQCGLFELVPELEWAPRVTLPLRAGDCTFHHGRTAHFAGPNLTGEDRIAQGIIYTDAATRFSGGRHVVTKSLELQPGDPLEGELFPLVSSLPG